MLDCGNCKLTFKRQIPLPLSESDIIFLVAFFNNLLKIWFHLLLICSYTNKGKIRLQSDQIEIHNCVIFLKQRNTGYNVNA